MIYKIVDGIEIGYHMVDGKQVAPSEEEIADMAQRAKDHAAQVEADKATEYQRLRAAEYPPIEEVVVALREYLGENRPEALQTIEVKVQAVKAKYPKPDSN